MRDVIIPKTGIVEYDKGVSMHFVKSKYDGCTWNKNSSTWEMLKHRYDNGSRDSQRSKLYEAEHDLIPPADDNSLEFHDVILKLAEVVNDTWFRKKFGRLFSDEELEVENARPSQNMAYALGTLKLSFPPHFCNVPIILHELTHIIVDRLSFVVHFRKKYAVHGRMFAFIYLELVKKYMGSENHAILKSGYKEFNVKYHNRIPQTLASKRLLRERFANNILNNK